MFYYIKIKPLPTFHGCHENLLSHGRVDFFWAMTFALWLLAASTPLELCPPGRTTTSLGYFVFVALRGCGYSWSLLDVVICLGVRASTSRVCCHPSPNACCTQHSTWAATVFESDGFYLSFRLFLQEQVLLHFLVPGWA